MLRSSFVQAYVIPSGSIEPTILVGDRIFVNKLAYGQNPRDDCGRSLAGLSSGNYLFRAAPIHRGDIIVFTAPYDRSIDLIKRVIGVPGNRSGDQRSRVAQWRAHPGSARILINE